MSRITRASEVAAVDLAVCDACGLCLALCPPTAIRLRRDGLSIDPIVCTGCRKCIDPCPVGALRMVDATIVVTDVTHSTPPTTPLS